jgi:hypothetical protein
VFDGKGKAGYIDKTGKLVIPTTWASAAYHDSRKSTAWNEERNSEFSEGLAAVSVDDGKYGKFGYIDKIGNTVVPPQFLYARPFSEGLAAVENGQFGFGYIDAQGKVIIPLIYQNVFVGNFSEGLARVKSDGEITYVDHQVKPQVTVKPGNPASPYFSMYDVTDFSEGFAAVSQRDGTAGYIDTSGKIVISLPKDGMGCRFHGGLARVFVVEQTSVPGKTERGYDMAYIDKSGSFVLKPSPRTRTLLLFTGDDGRDGWDECN